MGFSQFIKENNATANATKNPLAVDLDESYNEEARQVYGIQPMDPEPPHPPALEQVYKAALFPTEQMPEGHPETPAVVSRVNSALGLTKGVDPSDVLFQPEEMNEHNEYPSNKWAAGIQFEAPSDSMFERLITE